ncbi:sensor domain-containing protein [Actinosynnema sp. NPDC047251]|uniref:sensor histidine kinase n=1 Tax=Saccharothrix espanaensis TaxID=103731 RepID=UPI0002E1BBDF|nr:sensor domain-containing protein [Saccharothrix espanaensis]
MSGENARVGRWAGLRHRLRDAIRSCGYLVVGFGTSLVSLLALTVLPALTVVLGLLLVGVFGIPRLAGALRVLIGFDRRRVARYLGVEVPVPYRPLEGPASVRLATTLSDPATRRDLVWLLFHAVVGIPLGIIGLTLSLGTVFGLTIPLWWYLLPADKPVSMIHQITSWPTALSSFGQGVAYVVIALLIAPPLARLHARVGRRLLSPGRGGRVRLAEQVARLSVSRAAALDAHGMELRRIEGALHDDTQNRIVAVSMHLGMVESALRRDPETALPLVLRAQDAATDALAGLREVVRGIYPPILADRGLDGALTSLASHSGVPCELDVVDVPRAPTAVEAAAYYVVSEALTNVSKHSGARSVRVRVAGAKGNLRITVTDDGLGGAAEGQGRGLTGMRRRVEAFSGAMSLTSPPGGPTVLEVVLPCAS